MNDDKYANYSKGGKERKQVNAKIANAYGEATALFARVIDDDDIGLVSS